MLIQHAAREGDPTRLPQEKRLRRGRLDYARHPGDWRRPRCRQEQAVPAGEEPKPELPAIKETITYEDFARLDMRVGQVLHCEKVKKSKKLLRIEVDLGLEQRQILAGLAQHYTPEQLLGRKVIVLANLAPRKMMGLQSEGMLLAASLDESLAALGIDPERLEQLPNGSPVS